MESHLFFIPSFFKTDYIRPHVHNLKNKINPDKMFEYNIHGVNQINDLNSCDKFDRCLHNALIFIKDYANTCHMSNEKIIIHLFTDGYSQSLNKVDNISEYLPNNIIEFNYYEMRNPYFFGTPDFKESWLEDKRVKYINLM